MAVSTVTPASIAVELGRPTPDQSSAEWASWSQWIDDAELAIRVGLTQRGVTTGLEGLDQQVLAYVVRQAVVTKALTPADGAAQVDVAIDDGRVSRRYESRVMSVAILPEWWAMLLPTADQGGDAYAIDTLGGGSAHLPWCNLAFGANWCSCGADIAGEPIFELGDLP